MLLKTSYKEIMVSLVKKKKIGMYIIMVFIFWGAFYFNLFGEDEISNTRNFDLFSEELMLSDVIYNSTYGDRKIFIQMDLPELGQGIIKNKYINNIPIPKKNYETYYSQLGIHSKVYRIIDKLSPFSKSNNLRFFYLLNSMMLSVALVYIIKWIESNFGKSVGFGVFFMLAFFAPDLNQFGKNLYWVGWILFVPMCTSILVLKLISCKKKLVKFQPILWFAGAYIGCLIKFLCYYEFTPTVMVCMMIPYMLFILSNTEWKLKSFIINCMFPTLGAIGAFLTSLIIKFIAIYRILGNKRDTWSTLMQPIRNRITGNSTEQVLQDSINAPTLEVVKSYINRLAFSIGELNFFYRDLIILFILFSFIGYYLVKNCEEHKKKAVGLIISLWISIIAPISWFVLAKPHAYIHRNQCSIVWYLPFLILGWTLVFFICKLLIKEIKTRSTIIEKEGQR